MEADTREKQRQAMPRRRPSRWLGSKEARVLGQQRGAAALGSSTCLWLARGRIVSLYEVAETAGAGEVADKYIRSDAALMASPRVPWMANAEAVAVAGKTAAATTAAAAVQAAVRLVRVGRFNDRPPPTWLS